MRFGVQHGFAPFAFFVVTFLLNLQRDAEKQDGVPRVARASRLLCDASCVAHGGRQLANEPLPTSVCIPRDAKYGRRDARATQRHAVLLAVRFFCERWYEAVNGQRAHAKIHPLRGRLRRSRTTDLASKKRKSSPGW